MKLKNFIVFILFLNIEFIYSHVRRRCEDPKTICVRLYQCNSVLLKFNSNKRDIAALVQDSFCVYNPEKKTYKVCCPKKEIVSTKRRTKIIKKNLLPKNCGNYVIGDKIFGGYEVPIKAYTWMVALGYVGKHLEEPEFLCSATVISSRYLLTAAHCAHYKYNKKRQIVLLNIGDWNLTNPGKDCVTHADGKVECRREHIAAAPEDIIIHPEYSKAVGDENNDIALIRISTSLDFKGAHHHIVPICLPEKNVIPEQLESEPIAAGWGLTERNISSKILLEVPIPFANKSLCQEIFGVRGFKYSIEKTLCAGGIKGKDTCNRDSGGPLFISNKHGTKFTQIGIASAGSEECGGESKPALYTDVYKYKQWIIDNLKP